MRELLSRDIRGMEEDRPVVEVLRSLSRYKSASTMVKDLAADTGMQPIEGATTIKKMQRAGLVNLTPQGQISLTDQGWRSLEQISKQ
ncbi:MAG: hypothetical protein AAF619_03405 [Pseudomonadota bacterium]